MFRSITIALIAASAAFATAALAEVDCEKCTTTDTFYCHQSEPAVGYFTGPVNTAYATLFCDGDTGPNYLISEWKENWVTLIEGEEFGIWCTSATA